mmetsp:Transcript_10204/g.16147  ORF Transcript_10204/g.16147 Transcript_10204/m.16147 type:complete len:241 (-) Transcript_10204:395-1117(-)
MRCVCLCLCLRFCSCFCVCLCRRLCLWRCRCRYHCHYHCLCQCHCLCFGLCFCLHHRHCDCPLTRNQPRTSLPLLLPSLPPPSPSPPPAYLEPLSLYVCVCVCVCVWSGRVHHHQRKVFQDCGHSQRALPLGPSYPPPPFHAHHKSNANTHHHQARLDYRLLCLCTCLLRVFFVPVPPPVSCYPCRPHLSSPEKIFYLQRGAGKDFVAVRHFVPYVLGPHWVWCVQHTKHLTRAQMPNTS